MAKKVLVISTSLRERSNSEALADAFAEGAKAAGNEVEKISLRGKKISFCRGCLACLGKGRCVIQDDAPAITENEEGTDSRAIQGLEGWIACYERAQLKGTVFAGGVTGIGEMEGHPALKKAYDMGSAIQ